jgi:tRNA A37 N6-isopentenylltransferase MiaA
MTKIKPRRKASVEMLRERTEVYEVSEAYAKRQETYAKRQEKEEKFNAAKDERIRKNRKNEWTVVWQGGAPQ